MEQRLKSCFFCSGRHIKCDKVKPICGPCEKTNRPCFYGVCGRPKKKRSRQKPATKNSAPSPQMTTPSLDHYSNPFAVPPPPPPDPVQNFSTSLPSSGNGLGTSSGSEPFLIHQLYHLLATKDSSLLSTPDPGTSLPPSLNGPVLHGPSRVCVPPHHESEDISQVPSVSTKASPYISPWPTPSPSPTIHGPSHPFRQPEVPFVSTKASVSPPLSTTKDFVTSPNGQYYEYNIPSFEESVVMPPLHQPTPEVSYVSTKTSISQSREYIPPYEELVVMSPELPFVTTKGSISSPLSTSKDFGASPNGQSREYIPPYEESVVMSPLHQPTPEVSYVSSKTSISPPLRSKDFISSPHSQSREYIPPYEESVIMSPLHQPSTEMSFVSTKTSISPPLRSKDFGASPNGQSREYIPPCEEPVVMPPHHQHGASLTSPNSSLDLDPSCVFVSPSQGSYPNPPRYQSRNSFSSPVPPFSGSVGNDQIRLSSTNGSHSPPKRKLANSPPPSKKKMKAEESFELPQNQVLLLDEMRKLVLHNEKDSRKTNQIIPARLLEERHQACNLSRLMDLAAQKKTCTFICRNFLSVRSGEVKLVQAPKFIYLNDAFRGTFLQRRPGQGQRPKTEELFYQDSVIKSSIDFWKRVQSSDKVTSIYCVPFFLISEGLVGQWGEYHFRNTLFYNKKGLAVYGLCEFYKFDPLSFTLPDLSKDRREGKGEDESISNIESTLYGSALLDEDGFLRSDESYFVSEGFEREILQRESGGTLAIY